MSLSALLPLNKIELHELVVLSEIDLSFRVQWVALLILKGLRFITVGKIGLDFHFHEIFAVIRTRAIVP